MGTGWAVVIDGDIQVHTVCPTRRGAIVNWLVVNEGRMILSSDDDNRIEVYWEAHRRLAYNGNLDKTIEVKAVKITAVEA